MKKYFSNLENKKILFISVKLFSYENYILEKLVSLGANVIYYDERPKNTILVKSLIRIKRSIYQRQINKYYKKILNEIKSIKFNYFLLIKGEVIPQFFLNQIRISNPSITTIYYTFDSFRNNPNAINILPFFDKKFTFDQADSIRYNIRLRPLFFIDQYANNDDRKKNEIIDLLFIGTAHSDRLSITSKVNSICKKHNIFYYEYLYSHGLLFFLFLKLFNKSFRNLSFKKISFKSLLHSDIVSLFNISNVILDINHPGQDGLTMRTFEALGAKKKLITTNCNIINYSFYNKNNILVIDRIDPKIPPSFFQTKFENIEEVTYDKLRLQGWIQELFAEDYIVHWKFEPNE